MRHSGQVIHAHRLGVHDHVCWSYTDPADLASRVIEFLDDGLQHGLRVCYLAPGTRDELIDHLRGLPDLGRHLERGAVQVGPLPDAHPGRIIAPNQQIQVFAAATDEALADGFSGLRVTAEMTRHALTAEQIDALAVYEHLLDRYMAGHPFSAMCAYRSTDLPDGATAEIACMHPLVREGSTPFRVYAADEADAALAGEVDATVHDLFAASLGRAHLGNGNGHASGNGHGPVVIDGRDLGYIDHRGLFILRDHARRLGSNVVLRTSNPGPTRVIDVLDIEGIVVEAT